MMEMKEFDVLISGAGPAGLSAGILCAEEGMNVIICEKAEKPGPRPRAETVYDHPLFDRLIEPGFMKKIALYETSGRKFNSPGARKSFSINLSKGRVSCVFEWDDLIEGYYRRAREAGVTFLFNTEVIEPLMEGDVCKGVILADGRRLRGKTTLACDGHTSRLGRFAGIDYERINSIIIKSVVKNFESNYPGFEYFFIAHDELEYAPGFPPIVGFVFPRGNGMAETGLYIPSGAAYKIDPRGLAVDYDDVSRVWQKVKESYPGLSDIMAGTEVVHEEVTGIPVGALHEEAVMVPGLIFAGDTIGFLEATGASGIVTAMENAAFIHVFLKEKCDREWDAALKDEFNDAFRKSETFCYVKKRYAMTDFFFGTVFARFRTAKKINRHWWFVKMVYKLK